MDEVRLNVDRFCLLAGIEALQEMMEEDAAAARGIAAMGDRRGYRWGTATSGMRLSEAQRQKIAIAMCLLKQPDLLIINDAVSAFDSASGSRASRT